MHPVNEPIARLILDAPKPPQKSKGLKKPQDFMYMYSQANKDYFKNIMFRNYISYAF